MSITIFTATGCTRCKIVKGYMEAHQIDYVEKDMKAEGKDEFQSFYKANRNAVFRGPDGIEFPIITDGKNIRQSIGAAIAYLHAGEKLDGYFSVGTLHKEWVDGIHLSGGNPEYGDELIQVLKYIKGNNMKLQIDTDGRNSHILERVIAENLADVLIMDVIAPLELYGQILGKEIKPEEIVKSLNVITIFPEPKLQTLIRPVRRADGSISYLTPDEIAGIAKLIQEGTGSNKCRYFLKTFKSQDSTDKELQKVDPLKSTQLFSYRTKARTFQVFAEIEK
ncbi:hypothetical protein Desor_1251 [Desulfosporosinus orientis DSM 765]|uniref:Uncharacterized protein n=1 Tax=Desulfosporosinus orientis (strain ATCC 19365 / DSM 765 / NCIMB 8382 / VKM B-1628 / Singapore I) TaxID=768706 RepID=G7WEM2_DESOD|nr:hypothetical protein [Desulfosporosinus orientis]AET66913.1 hypothetical protein Desor_1251 [Desulfosporosinus orientis DSM 765]